MMASLICGKLVINRSFTTCDSEWALSSGICDRVTGLLTLDEVDRLRAHIIEAKTRLDEIK